MNKRIIVSAIRTYRKAYEYKEKMCKVIEIMAEDIYNKAYIVEEMIIIQHESEEIIAEESGFNDILNLEDYDEYTREIRDMIEDDNESEERIVARIEEIRKYNM